MKSAKPVSSRNRVTGFTLLEVLISIVVIAFGMLGVAGLQAFALKNGQSASQRSLATVLASDMIDRIKANPLGASDGFYDESAATAATVAKAPNCLDPKVANGCGGTKVLAGHDLAEWKEAVKAALPNAEALVCIDSVIDTADTKAPGDKSICSNTGGTATQYVIYIWWRDDRNRANTKGDSTRFATGFHI
jgi:type IV pilus assembly protein PilV